MKFELGTQRVADQVIRWRGIDVKTRETALCWEELTLGPQAWRDPSCHGGVERILEELTLMVSGDRGHTSAVAWVDRLLPSHSLLDIGEFEVDAKDALRPRGPARADGELVAWVADSLWRRPGAISGLRNGGSRVRVRRDGFVAQICIPLIPSDSHLTLVACSLVGEDRDDVLCLASRMTWLAAFVPGSHEPDELPEGQISLTRRQLMVLRAMARGLTNRQIASLINFSESTVRMESLVIYRFYDVHSREEAVSTAFAAGHLSEASVAAVV